MVRIARILRDYREAGSVNGLLALWGFVDDTTFLTKAGHVGVVYRIRGVDYEGLSHAQRETLAHRFGAALRLLDEQCRVYEYLVKRAGAQDLAYYMVMSSGENHPYVHYHKHDRTLQDGDFLVVDVGPDLSYYDIDITISYPANGRFTPRQKEVYEAARAVHEANMKVYRPGLTSQQCRDEVAALLKQQGFDVTKDYFQKMPGGFGHYVGMAVHDVGGSPRVLKAGMVIANEPMVIYAAENLGVRVEDTILITETGCENLTAGLPRAVKDIEALMKQPGIPQLLQKAAPGR